MESRNSTDLARALYAALGAGDRDQLDTLLHPQFTGRTAEGMPFSIGGQHDGPAAMRRNGWGAIALGVIASSIVYAEALLGEYFTYAQSMGVLASAVMVGVVLVTFAGPEAHGVSFRKSGH